MFNVDDIYGHRTEEFIHAFNRILMDITAMPLDIRQFHAARIDYCFNVETPFVKEYIDIFNRAFSTVTTGNRKNFTLERNLDGSAYIKPAAEYKNCRRETYTLNFYNKTDWICYREEHGQTISDIDKERATNILRLEVQASYKTLTAIAKKLKRQKTFGDLFAYNVAYQVIEMVYTRVYLAGAGQDFYKYQTAKQLVESPAAKEALELTSENHSIKNKPYAARLIKKAGIYPFAVVPKSVEVDILANPLRMIQMKLEDMGIDMEIKGSYNESASPQ